MSWEVASFSSREIASFKIFTKRQLILLAILLSALYCYFFIQSECLNPGKSEMCFNLHLLMAHFLFFAVTSEVLLSSTSWGIHYDTIWSCPWSFWENWILLPKLSGFRLQLRGCLCCWTWVLCMLGNTLLDFLV